MLITFASLLLLTVRNNNSKILVVVVAVILIQSKRYLFINRENLSEFKQSQASASVHGNDCVILTTDFFSENVNI